MIFRSDVNMDIAKEMLANKLAALKQLSGQDGNSFV